MIALCALTISWAANAQINGSETEPLTNLEISEIINRSKEVNEANGISDPDLVHEGDIITFIYTDGHMEDFTVQNGSHQWDIVRSAGKLQADHGAIVSNLQEPKPQAALEKSTDIGTIGPAETSADESISILGMDPFIFFSLLLLLVSLAFLAYVNREKIVRSFNKVRYNKDVYNPTDGGVPVVDGGIQDEDHARTVVQEAYVAQHNAANPRNPITTSDTSFVRGEKGHVYSDGETVTVEYYDNRKAERILDGEDAWRGVVRNNKTEDETPVIALEACGNALLSDLSKVRFEASADQPVNITRSDAEIAQEVETAQAAAEEEAKAATEAKAGDLDLNKIIEAVKMNGGEINMTSSDGKLKVNATIKRPKLKVVEEDAKPVEKKTA